MNDPYATGNYREDALQTLSSENGSITRVNNRYNDVSSYFLRTLATRMK